MSSKYFVLVIFVCLAVVAVAQTDTARVIGTITDTTGAVLPNATVTITDLGTGRVVTAKTNDTGGYTVNALPIGKYHVDVKMEGFKTSGADFTLSGISGP